MLPPLYPRCGLLSAERRHDERRACAPEEEGQTGREKGLLLGHAGNCTRSPVPLEQQSRRTRVRAAALCRVTAGKPLSVVEAAGIEPTEFGVKQRVPRVSDDLQGRGERAEVACLPSCAARCAALVTRLAGPWQRAPRPRRLLDVTSTAEKVLEDALALPEAERRIVAERLLDTVLGDDREAVAQAWAGEAIRRAGALERGEVAALDGETATAGLESKLRSMHRR